MNDENDEIISRLNRLKPVEPVLQPEPDIELLAKEEERTRLRDEYFDRKEKQERAELAKKCAIKHKSEPVQNSEPNNDEIIEEYNILDEDAKILLLNRPKMAKKAFIKKLDIYSIVMRKKLIETKKYERLKPNIDAMRNKLMKKQKIPVEVIIQMMKNIRDANT